MPEQTDKFTDCYSPDSGSSPLTNGFRLQPEELDVGTKLLIFVYLTLSEYTISLLCLPPSSLATSTVGV